MKTVERINRHNVEIEAPPSKAHTLRAIILASLADGKSVIRNPLLGDDQLHLIDCMKKLGVEIKALKDELEITGVNGRFKVLDPVLDAGESGVSMNVLCALGSLGDAALTLTGAEGLLKRPVDQVVEGMRQLGCQIEYMNAPGFPPLKIQPTGIVGGTAKISGRKTSQYFSSITLASPLAQNPVQLECKDILTERPYYDITTTMMEKFGVAVENNNYSRMRVPNDRGYSACDIDVEGDYSSASFFFLAAAICKSTVTVKRLVPDSVQGDKAFLGLMKRMGCGVFQNETEVTVTGNDLSAIQTDMKDIPDLVPCVAVACAYAKGKSILTGVGHLRNKECDRLEAMREGLDRMGVECGYDEDSMWIVGTDKMHAAEINPYNDHRIAMSFAVAGLPFGGQVIQDETCVKKSFPDFWDRFAVFHG